MKKFLFLFSVSVFVCVGSVSAGGGYAMFLKLPGVAGQDAFQGKTGWISLASFKIGPADAKTGAVARPVILALPSKTTGPPVSQIGSLAGMGIELTKYVDKSSPAILSAWRDKTRFSGAQLILCSAGDHTQVTYDFKLTGVSLSHCRESGTQQILGLNFEKIEFH